MLKITTGVISKTGIVPTTTSVICKHGPQIRQQAAVLISNGIIAWAPRTHTAAFQKTKHSPETYSSKVADVDTPHPPYVYPHLIPP